MSRVIYIGTSGTIRDGDQCVEVTVKTCAPGDATNPHLRVFFRFNVSRPMGAVTLFRKKICGQQEASAFFQGHLLKVYEGSVTHRIRSDCEEVNLN